MFTFRVINIWVCAIIALSLFIWGCGYGSRSKAFEHIDSVTISPMTNETVEYGLEDDLSEAIRQEFSRRSSWSEGTDSIFTGTIKTYEVLPLSLDQNNQVEQYRLVLEMGFVFEDLKRNKILQNEKNYQKLYDFYVVPDRGEPPETLKEAKENLIKEVSEEVVASIIDEW